MITQLIERAETSYIMPAWTTLLVYKFCIILFFTLLILVKFTEEKKE